MTTFTPRALLALSLAAALAGCGSMGGPTALVDGTKGLDNFNRVGEANWSGDRRRDPGDPGRQGRGLPRHQGLVHRLRHPRRVLGQRRRQQRHLLPLPEPAAISDETCYEANIFDQRPDPTYGTGAIVKVAAVSPMPKAGGKWNTYEITARGKRLTLVLNGVKTVDIEDAKLASGPFALQWGRGTIKFRKVEITPL